MRIAALALVVWTFAVAPASAKPLPGDDAAVKARFQQAKDLWRAKKFDKAIVILDELVANHRNSAVGEFAVNILLDALVQTKRYDRLEQIVAQVLADKSFLAGKRDLRARLTWITIQAERKRAEMFERRGEYDKCAAAYLSIYNRNPAHGRLDEVLYNAAICMMQAKDIGRAIALFQKLVKQYPRSGQAARSLVLLGRLYGDIAEYKRAAEVLEQYARMYAGEKDAATALSLAMVYRRGLGQDELAIKNIEYFIRVFGKKRRLEAAVGMLLIGTLYEETAQPKKALKAYRRYLKQFGGRGGRERRVIASTRAGRLAWQLSCPRPAADSSCTRVRRRRGKTAVVVAARDRVLSLEAQKHFKRAANHFEKLGPPESHDDRRLRAQAVHAYGAARFYLAEPAFEELLAETKPAKSEVLAKKHAERSRQLLSSVNPHWQVASAARSGQAAERVGVADRTLAAFAFCFDLSQKTNLLSRWTRLCENKLVRLAPVDYPAANEVHAPPTRVGPVLDTEPLLTHTTSLGGHATSR